MLSVYRKNRAELPAWRTSIIGLRAKSVKGTNKYGKIDILGMI
jgi:hypothetical protein